MSFTSGQILTASQLNTFAPGTRITNADGSTSAPAYSFSTDDNTGFYVTGNEGRIRFVGDGTPGGWLSNTGIRTVDGSASVPSYSFTSDSNTGMFRSGTDTIGLATNGTQVVTISSDGRLGVGDTSPSATLHVNAATANTTAVFESTDAEAYIGLKDNSSGSDLHVAVAAISDDLVLRAGNSNAVRVKDDGDVGIGTTTPSARLHVDSGATNLGLLVESTDAGAIIGLKDNSTSGNDHVGIRATGNSLILRSNNANQVTIATDGSIRAVDGSASAPTYVFDSDTNTGFFVTGNNGRIHFSGNGVEGGYLLSTGGRFIDGSATAPSYAFRDDTNTGMFRKATDTIGFATAGNEVGYIDTSHMYITGTDASYVAADPATGTGNDAEWSSVFGVYLLRRNSSLASEKLGITADLGSHLTADMIDSVVPKMWTRDHAPDYPEIGPIADDMDAISPFLGAKGTDANGEQVLTGIDRNAYLSLLVLAVKDLRTRVAALESA